jgi:hypothetical protein
MLMQEDNKLMSMPNNADDGPMRDDAGDGRCRVTPATG